MEIVIDIPNSLYANLSKITNGSIAGKRILDCVKNGTPLPKKHGRLIDANEVTAYNNLYEVPTIIGADKGENDGK